ncbi:MAG: hypothetical protein ACR2QH_11780 [Geminicoccaceae bacterium]
MESPAKANGHPIALISILHRYSREHYGSIFLYLPRPTRRVDRQAWAWLQFLKSVGVARKRWLVSADHALVTIGETHPHLFEPPPVCLETYRLSQQSLNKTIARL